MRGPVPFTVQGGGQLLQPGGIAASDRQQAAPGGQHRLTRPVTVQRHSRGTEARAGQRREAAGFGGHMPGQHRVGDGTALHRDQIVDRDPRGQHGHHFRTGGGPDQGVRIAWIPPQDIAHRGQCRDDPGRADRSAAADRQAASPRSIAVTHSRKH